MAPNHRPSKATIQYMIDRNQRFYSGDKIPEGMTNFVIMDTYEGLPSYVRFVYLEGFKTFPSIGPSQFYTVM